MKRSLFASATAALALAIGTVGAVAPAAAAPPDSDWSASAASDVVSLTLSTLGIDLADLGVSTSEASAGTTLSPRASSTSANLSADVLGLGLGVVENTQTAPPTTAPSGLDLLAANALVLNLGALTSTNEANWTVDEACVTDGVLSSAQTEIAGLDVLAGTVNLGAASVTSTTQLVHNSGSNYSVQSVTTGTIADLSLLNGAIEIDVRGTPTLSATAASLQNEIIYTPAAVFVTVAGTETPLITGDPRVIVLGTTVVSITLNRPVLTPPASASLDVLSISIDSLLGTDVNLGVLPMSVSVNAPVGGIDCPPPAPVITAPANGSTTNATPTIAGTSAPSASVEVFIDGASVGTTTASGVGAWTLPVTTPLATGSHTATATQTVAGQDSPSSAPVTFTVDATAPPAPVIVSPTNGQVLNDSTPAISGTAEANSTVTVYIDGASAGTTPADGTGDWTFVPASPLADGTHSAYATATDAAGNVSGDSNTVSFTIDATLPSAPIIVNPANGSWHTTTPPISGTAEANSTVTVYIDGTEAGTTTTDGAGDWTFTPATPLPDGAHTALATATDAAGNVSPNSNTVTFTIDGVAPSAPIIVTPTDGEVLGDSTPTITGTAEANSTVTVIIDGTTAGTTTADGAGNWTFTPGAPLADGPHVVTATATDATGNTGPQATPVTFTIDTVAPAAPVIITPTEGEVLGDSTPTITGTAEANSTVTVIIDGTTAGTTTADGAGNWTFTPGAPLADGPHVVTATATDATGNTSPQATPVNFIIDATSPAAPVIITPTDGEVIDDSTPEITGTAEPGSTVTVIIDGEPVGTTTADENGDWTFTPTTPLDDGDHTITATATDEAGNTGPQAQPITVTIDVPGLPDVQLSMTPSSQTVDSESKAVIMATVRNTGESTATDVVVTLEMPAGFTDYSGVAVAWPDGQSKPPNGVVGSLTFEVGDLGPGQAVTYRVEGIVSGQPGSTLTITGAATQAEADAYAADNSAEARIVVASAGGLPITGGDAPLGALLPATLLLLLGGLVIAIQRRRVG